MIKSIILALPLFGSFIAQAAPQPEDTPKLSIGIPGYEIVPLEWEFEITPGGPTVLLNGTVEQVYHELLKINPDYEAQFGTIEENALKAVEARKVKRDESLIEARQYRDWTDCKINDWRWATFGRIEDGIRYLYGVNGRPGNGPGPARCGRVSCSFGSAIYWCNDNNYDFSLDSYRNIADGAWVIIHDCPTSVVGIIIQTRGQRFHGNNWNVIVRGGEDC